MKLEIYFHNSYHYNKDQEITEALSPDQDYDDHLHYPDLIPGPKVQTDDIIIEDINNEIKSIDTNNPRCIKISTKINKGLFKKVKIYTISFNNQGNGYIKIKYRNGKPMEIKSFSGAIQDSSMKLGSLSGHEPEYWIKDDPFIGNKYIDCMYSYSTMKLDIENHINICYQMGAECIFIYKQFDIGNLDNKVYIEKYIKGFVEYTSIISQCGIVCTVIYEPDLITDIYNSGNRNPNNIYINTGETKISLTQFISQMHSVSQKQGIGFVNVINTRVFNDLTRQVIDILDFDRYIAIMKNKAIHLAEYISYFKNSKYLAFQYTSSAPGYLESNDEHLASLFIVKCILENTQLQGILFGIPVGHVNYIESISRYTNTSYKNHTDKPGDYQASATFFLFGGCAVFNDSKFHQNKFKDTGLIVNGSNVCCNEHISLCDTFNIKYIMFGPTTPEDTTNVPLKSRGNKCTDHNYTITKVNEYYKNV